MTEYLENDEGLLLPNSWKNLNIEKKAEAVQKKAEQTAKKLQKEKDKEQKLAAKKEGKEAKGKGVKKAKGKAAKIKGVNGKGVKGKGGKVKVVKEVAATTFLLWRKKEDWIARNDELKKCKANGIVSYDDIKKYQAAAAKVANSKCDRMRSDNLLPSHVTA